MTLPDTVQRYAPELWDSVRPLYQAGRYADAAEKGRELIEAHPNLAYLHYQVALREPCGPEHGRDRAPPPGDRQMGGLSRHGQAGLRLRPDPDEPAAQELIGR